MQTLPTRFRPDCARCTGLCCVAPPFDAEQGFGFDKPAHVPCTHLGTDFRCAIHAQLATAGFPACAHFDCYGAGQQVTAQFAAQGNWATNPELAASIFESYQRTRAIHELLAMTTLALARASSATQQAPLTALLENLELIAAGAPCTDLAALRRDCLKQIRAALAV